MNKPDQPSRLIITRGPLARYVQLRVCMRRECRERFSRHAGKRSRHASRHVRGARVVMFAGIAK